MAWEYSEKTKQLFLDAVHGKPGTHLGEIENPDGVGEHGSVACGDALRFTFEVERCADDPRKDIIVKARYLTFGCTSAIAASEALCCILEDRRLTPIEALKISNDDIVEFLEGLPKQKIHCSVMGAEALEAAVFDWARRRGVNLAELGIESHTAEEEEGRLVCKCFGMTEPYIKRKIKELDLHSISEITGAIKAGGACMGCHHAPGGLQDLLDEVWGSKKFAGSAAIVKSSESAKSTAVSQTASTDQERAAFNSDAKNRSDRAAGGAAGAGFVPLVSLENFGATATASGPDAAQNRAASPQETAETLSPYQRAKKIEQIIDSYVRPMIQRDGGNLEILDIKDKIVYVELTGACAECSSATQTLRFLVENTLKTQVDREIRVIQV